MTLCNLPKNFKFLLFRDWAPIEILLTPNFFKSTNFFVSYELGLASREISMLSLKLNTLKEVFNIDSIILSGISDGVPPPKKIEVRPS